MRQIELFAGIGGFGLAGHWAGIETVCQVEIDKFCQQVLAKNFPNARRHDDIHTFDGTEYAGTVDIISGGFPCQPFSSAGKRKGNEDDRALWPQMLRVIREVRPRWVVGENVVGLLTMDGGKVFDEILTSLENEGYKTQAFVIPACAVGAPHRRDRVWIVGYAQHVGCNSAENRKSSFKGIDYHAPKPDNVFRSTRPDFSQIYTPDASVTGLQRKNGVHTATQFAKRTIANPNPGSTRLQGREQRGAYSEWQGAFRPVTEFYKSQWREHWHEVATRLCRMDDGIPGRVDRHRAKRLKALGNAIVPQIAYLIFEAIKAYEHDRT